MHLCLSKFLAAHVIVSSVTTVAGVRIIADPDGRIIQHRWAIPERSKDFSRPSVAYMTPRKGIKRPLQSSPATESFAPEAELAVSFDQSLASTTESLSPQPPQQHNPGVGVETFPRLQLLTSANWQLEQILPPSHADNVLPVSPSRSSLAKASSTGSHNAQNRAPISETVTTLRRLSYLKQASIEVSSLQRLSPYWDNATRSQMPPLQSELMDDSQKATIEFVEVFIGKDMFDVPLEYARALFYAHHALVQPQRGRKDRIKKFRPMGNGLRFRFYEQLVKQGGLTPWQKAVVKAFWRWQYRQSTKYKKAQEAKKRDEEIREQLRLAEENNKDQANLPYFDYNNPDKLVDAPTKDEIGLVRAYWKWRARHQQAVRFGRTISEAERKEQDFYLSSPEVVQAVTKYWRHYRWRRKLDKRRRLRDLDVKTLEKVEKDPRYTTLMPWDV